MFDKRRCHARLAAAGRRRYRRRFPDRCDYGELRASMRAAGWSRVFVKPAHGSSACGRARVAGAPGGRVRVTTSVELVRDGERVRLFNSLRVRDYRDERDVASIVDRAGTGRAAR